MRLLFLASPRVLRFSTGTRGGWSVLSSSSVVVAFLFLLYHPGRRSLPWLDWKYVSVLRESCLLGCAGFLSNGMQSLATRQGPRAYLLVTRREAWMSIQVVTYLNVLERGLAPGKT